MKRILAIATALTVSVYMCAQSTVFVSSSCGDDSNDGKNQTRPVKTIAHACELGSDIRLRRGDWFYESISQEGVRVRPYGGKKFGKPVLCGFRKVPAGMLGENGKSVWVRGSFTPEGIWRHDETGNIYRLDFTVDGFGGYSDNPAPTVGNVGTIYDPATDTMYGRKCQAPNAAVFDSLDYKTGTPYTYPSRNMDMYQPWGEFRYLYVMADDPGLLRDRELWLSIGGSCIRGGEKDIAGIKVFGWGCHGAAVRSNVTIASCEFDIIGGSFLTGYQHWVRYGNGVEFWATSSQHSEVHDCMISRVYDTGSTIQGPMGAESVCDSIIFHHNTFRNCRQDFEVWIKSDGKMPTRCAFVDNVGYDSGNNGFEDTEFNGTHYLHYVNVTPISGITIKDNEFWNGEGLYYSPVLNDMPIGRTVYHCKLGAPVLKNRDGLLVPAPEKVEGGYRYAFYVSGLTNDTIEWKIVPALEEAVTGLQKTIGDLTGDYEVVLIVE